MQIIIIIIKILLLLDSMSKFIDLLSVKGFCRSVIRVAFRTNQEARKSCVPDLRPL